MEKRKNCWLIPTDEPSTLGYLTKKGKEVYKDLRLFDKLMPNILDSENQHLYITSDEEIKVRDFFIGEDGEVFRYHLQRFLKYSYKKIILTTDQELIKDGVQRIDEEFLEWFVKNPTCEKVEIDKLSVRNITGYGAGGDVECYYTESYKIIIPKEEPKQELHLNWWKSLSTWYLKTEMMKKHGYDFKLVDEDIDLHPDDIKIIWGKEQKQETLEETFNFQEKLVEYFNNTPREKILEDWDKSVEYDKIGPTMEEFLESKQDYKKLSKKFTETLTIIPDDVLIKYTQQETLEEVAERMFPNRDDLHLKREFRHGANYQAKRSYNKEDMIEASKYGYNFHKTTQFPEQEFEDSCIRNTQQWLTQFKKNIKL